LYILMVEYLYKSFMSLLWNDLTSFPTVYTHFPFYGPGLSNVPY
jgi:hypothetical protein